MLQAWVRRRCIGAGFVRPRDPAVASPAADRAERQARVALRWYPRFWREEHGEELLATVLDAADPSGVGGLSLRTRVDLRWGALGQRRRSHPPLRWTMTIGLYQRFPPPEYRGWVRDRFDSPLPVPGWWVAAALVVGFASAASQTGFGLRPLGWSTLGAWMLTSTVWFTTMVGMRVATGTRYRSRELRKVGLSPDGTWLDTLPAPPWATTTPPVFATPSPPPDPRHIGPA